MNNKIFYPDEYFLLFLSCADSQSVVSLYIGLLGAFGERSRACVSCTPSSASEQLNSLSQGWAFKSSILLQRFSVLTKQGE